MGECCSSSNALSASHLVPTEWLPLGCSSFSSSSSSSFLLALLVSNHHRLPALISVIGQHRPIVASTITHSSGADGVNPARPLSMRVACLYDYCLGVSSAGEK